MTGQRQPTRLLTHRDSVACSREESGLNLQQTGLLQRIIKNVALSSGHAIDCSYNHCVRTGKYRGGSNPLEF